MGGYVSKVAVVVSSIIAGSFMSMQIIELMNPTRMLLPLPEKRMRTITNLGSLGGAFGVFALGSRIAGRPDLITTVLWTIMSEVTLAALSDAVHDARLTDMIRININDDAQEFPMYATPRRLDPVEPEVAAYDDDVQREEMCGGPFDDERQRLERIRWAVDTRLGDVAGTAGVGLD